MRAMAVAMLVLCFACDVRDSSQTSPPVPDEPTTFEGATVIDAAARIQHGERLTRVLGCRGCHGPDLQGELWDDDPEGYGIMWASTSPVPFRR